MPSSPSAPSGLRSLGEHLCASFPITPSRTYGNAALKEGRVHLDLLAGRENARGTVGGNAATTITDGTVQLNVAAGSLDEDTAIAFFAYDTFSSFIPTTNGITALGEVTIDLGSSTLNTSASLTFHNVAAAPGDTLVVARVDRAEFDGIPRLQVVALADVVTANGETSAVSRVDTGLPALALDGIKIEGRYTLLRLANPIGWLKGVTNAGGSPVRALVSTNTPPFFATSNGSGAFAIPAAPGAVTLTARVPGQSLVGSASAVAIEGTPVTADIALQGTVSQATVVPVSGSVGIEVNEPLTLTSPVALNPNTVTPANISLRRVPPQRCADPDPPAGLNCAATQILLRLVLSGSGKQLSIVPTGPITIPATPALEFSTDYRLEVTGLLDTVGGLVTAPTTNFRTKDDVKPVYNLKALTFSFPNADGLVTVSEPNGTFPPGTEILIINSGNGVVVGLTAGNDGQVSGAIPAGLSDTLFVSVTDPFGNTTSFESSKFFDPATGQTAIGPGGGTIEGPQGTAIQIPEGALSEGIPFRLDVLSPEEYDTQFPNERPAFGTRPIGTVLKISAAQPGTFHRPVKLTFNVPANFASTHPGADPRDAVFYALKRSTLPGGALGFEVVDHAFAVCPGDAPGGDLPPRDDPQKPTCAVSDLTVKTASPPHPEFTGQFLADIYIILTYDWSSAGVRTALAGTVVGRVRRQAWGGGDQAGQVRYEPVQGAVVFGSDAQGNPLQSAKSLFAISQKDGTYTLWDDAYKGGAVTVHAFSGGETATGRGFEGNPQDVSASWGPFPALRFYQNKAHVDVVFEAQAPPPPAPDVDVVVMRDSDRVDTRGLSTVGTPLRIAFRSNRKNESVTIGSLDINGENFTVSLDPTGTFAGITQDVWTPSQSGTYVLKTTALAPIGGSIPVSTTVRIVAAGGGVDTDQTQPPRVLDQRTYPKRGARNVQTAIFPTIAFSEPVVGITHSTVQFTRSDSSAQGPVPPPATSEAFKITGVTAAGQVIDDVTTAPTLPITAITIRPLYGLKYRQHYTLSLTDGIQDLDTAGGTPSPKALVPYTTTFDTFGPEPIPPDGEPASTTTTGFYVAKNAEGDAVSMWSLKHQIAGSNWFGLLTGYDVTDPINVVETTSLAILGRPIDLVGEGSIVAVATAPGVKSLPSNVRLYDVSDPANPSWVGAASLTTAISEGTVNRITLRGNRVYAGTYRKGIQILDVESMRSALEPCCGVGYFKAVSDLNLDQKGFNQAAVIAGIPVPGPAGQQSFFTGIKSIPQSAEPLIVATGNFGLALARESSPGGTVYRGMPSKDGETLQYGLALDVATVEGYDIAVVAAISGPRQVLMTVDVTNPLLPVVRSVREIVADGGVVDVLVNATLVYVSTQKATTPAALAVEVFDISDLSTVAHLGRINGVGGRLSLVGKLLYGATSGTFGAPIEGLGGVRSAALGPFALIEGTNPPVVVVGEGPRAAEDFTLKYRVIPSTLEIESAQIEYRYADATVGAPAGVTLNPDGRGELPLPRGFTFPTAGSNVAQPRLSLRTTEGEEVVGPLKPWRHDVPTLEFAFDDEEQADHEFTADQPVARVVLASKEWYERSLAGDNPARVVLWETTAPVRTGTQNSISREGLFETTLDAGTLPNSARLLTARVDDVVLSVTQTIPIEPGIPSQVLVAPEGGRLNLPADGATEIMLDLQARDAFGNEVSDGTPVHWETDGDGDLVEAIEETSHGTARVKYRAGDRFVGPVVVRARVGDAQGSVELTQHALDIQLAPSLTDAFLDTPSISVIATLTSAGGPISDQAAISWVSSSGRVVNDLLTAGVSHATWTPASALYRPRFAVQAQIGGFRKSVTFRWVPRLAASSSGGDSSPAAGGPHVTLESSSAPAIQTQDGPDAPIQTLSSAVIAADRTEDGFIDLPLPDGTTELLPVRATTVLAFRGLAMGQHIRVNLGSTSHPNVAPLFTFDGAQGIVGSTVPDIMGDHDATFTGSLSTDPQGLFGPAYELTGSGLIRVPNHPDFDFSNGFMVQAAVRPPSNPEAGILAQKPGEWTLDLVSSGGGVYPRFEVLTTDGPVSVTAAAPLFATAWSVVSGKFEGGRISVSVGRASETVVLSAPRARSVQDIEIGRNLKGALDEIRLFDLSRMPGSVFPNGQSTVDLVADSEGVASVEIRSTGALARAAEAYGGLAELGLRRARYAVDPVGATSQETFGGYFTEAVAAKEGEAEEAITPVGYALASMQARFLRVVSGVWGASPPDDPLAIAGDLTFFLITTPRDVWNSSTHAIRGQANGWDALILTTAVISAAAAVLSKKAALLGKLKKLGSLAGRGEAAGPVARRLTKALVATIDSLPTAADDLGHLAEVASTGSVEAKNALGALLQDVGDHARRVDRLEGVLKLSANAEETVKELNAIRQKVGRKNFLKILAVMGSCAVGSVAADSASAACSKLSVAARRGERLAIERLLAAGKTAEQASETLALIYRGQAIATKNGLAFGADTNKLFEAIERFAQKSTPGITKVIEDLGHVGVGFNLGARRVLIYAHGLDSTPNAIRKVVEFERKSEKIVGLRSEKNYRVFDLIVTEGSKTLRMEFKAWKNIPPSGKVWRSAAFQMAKDMVQSITNARDFPKENLRWVFNATHAGEKAEILKILKEDLGNAEFVRAILNAQSLDESARNVEAVKALITSFAEHIDNIVEFLP